MPGFAKLRTAQRGLKQAILRLSGFHLLTENVMAKADMGPSAMYQASEVRPGKSAVPDERARPDRVGRDHSHSGQHNEFRFHRNLANRERSQRRREVIPRLHPRFEAGTRSKSADAITRLTFDNVQRKFKVWSFALHRDAWLRDNPDGQARAVCRGEKRIASYVNGVYGGLHWENMGIPRAMDRSRPRLAVGSGLVGLERGARKVRCRRSPLETGIRFSPSRRRRNQRGRAGEAVACVLDKAGDPGPDRESDAQPAIFGQALASATSRCCQGKRQKTARMSIRTWCFADRWAT